MLDKRFLDELRSRVTLSEVIGRRVRLTRAGREFKACCPFHDEKSASFYVNDQKGFFHCFGCGAHGDAVSFRMRHDNVGFMEAVESLAGEAGMALPAADPQASERYDEMQRLQQILERVTVWFEQQLRHPQNAFALRYARERRLSDDTLSQFRIGYAPNNWDALREAMVAMDIKISDMIDLGLLRQSTREDKADKPYSFFRGRIIFPVTDAKGRVIAFGGRHLDAAFAGQTLTEKPPKYINSSEHALFNKGTVLYSLARARALVGPQTPLIVVEGYMDVIALAQAGFQTAVAPLGTALTEDHMSLAWKISPMEAPPILCFDGDKAGQNAAYRAIDRLLPHLSAQRNLRLAFLPQGEDPDSLVRAKGPEAVQTVLGNAIGVFDALWQRGQQQYPVTSPEKKAALQVALEAQVHQVKDPLLQQSYRQALKDRLYQLGRNQPTPMGKTGASKYEKGRKLQGPSSILPQPISLKARPLEAWAVLLAMAVNHPHLLLEYAEELGAQTVPDPELDQLREALVTIAHQMGPDDILTTETIKESLSVRGLNPILSLLNHKLTVQASTFVKPDAPAEQVLEGWKDVWMRLQLRTVESDKTKLLQAVKTTQSDEAIDRLFALSQQEQSLLDDTTF